MPVRVEPWLMVIFNGKLASSHDVRLPNFFPILCIDGILTHCMDIFFTICKSLSWKMWWSLKYTLSTCAAPSYTNKSNICNLNLFCMANESDSGQPMPGTHETTILCTMFKGIIKGWNCNLKKKHGTILLPEIGISSSSTHSNIAMIDWCFSFDIKSVWCKTIISARLNAIKDSLNGPRGINLILPQRVIQFTITISKSLDKLQCFLASWNE